MNVGDIRGRTVMSTAERIVKRHGGQFGHGQWSQASGLTEDQAKALEADLLRAGYQVRSRAQLVKGGKWNVTFR